MSDISKPYTRHDPEAWRRYQEEWNRIFGKKEPEQEEKPKNKGKKE